MQIDLIRRIRLRCSNCGHVLDQPLGDDVCSNCRHVVQRPLPEDGATGGENTNRMNYSSRQMETREFKTDNASDDEALPNSIDVTIVVVRDSAISRYSVKIMASDRVSELKERHQNNVRIPSSRQMWIYKGVRLNDEDTVEEIGIGQNDTIVCHDRP